MSTVLGRIDFKQAFLPESRSRSRQTAQLRLRSTAVNIKIQPDLSNYFHTGSRHILINKIKLLYFVQ